MQVITLLDKEMMPDNDCRKLYNLHQFVTITLQSINAYYMFQKPNVAFVYDADFNTDQLMQAYPNADTFAIAIIWRFAENVTAATSEFYFYIKQCTWTVSSLLIISIFLFFLVHNFFFIC